MNAVVLKMVVVNQCNNWERECLLYDNDREAKIWVNDLEVELVIMFGIFG
jgi:hypothetical protein